MTVQNNEIENRLRNLKTVSIRCSNDENGTDSFI